MKSIFPLIFFLGIIDFSVSENNSTAEPRFLTFKSTVQSIRVATLTSTTLVTCFNNADDGEPADVCMKKKRKRKSIRILSHTNQMSIDEDLEWPDESGPKLAALDSGHLHSRFIRSEPMTSREPKKYFTFTTFSTVTVTQFARSVGGVTVSISIMCFPANGFFFLPC